MERRISVEYCAGRKRESASMDSDKASAIGRARYLGMEYGVSVWFLVGKKIFGRFMPWNNDQISDMIKKKANQAKGSS